jgi:hypothetical protein
VSGPRSSKKQNHSHHSRAEAHAGPKELDDVHGAIRLEARTLRDSVKAGQPDHQGNNKHHNRRTLAINHSAPSREPAALSFLGLFSPADCT